MPVSAFLQSGNKACFGCLDPRLQAYRTRLMSHEPHHDRMCPCRCEWERRVEEDKNFSRHPETTQGISIFNSTFQLVMMDVQVTSLCPLSSFSADF